MGGAVRESRSALKSGAVHGPAECSWSVQRCKRSEGEMKVIVGAAASIPFFHFGSTLMGLVCCLYCLILSVVITAAYIITSSCYPRASSCTSYLRSVLLPWCPAEPAEPAPPPSQISITVASFELSSCNLMRQVCYLYVFQSSVDITVACVVGLCMLFRVTARAYRLAVRITVASFVLSSCKRS